MALGVKLERLYRLWQQMFIRYYASEADVVALFDGRAKAGVGRSPLHQRRVFPRPRRLQPFAAADDAQHRNLRRRLPASKPAAGLLLRRQGQRRPHVVPRGHAPVVPRVAAGGAADVGRKANFWIVEGIAMYMESLRQEDGYYVLGGFDDERMHAARYRLLHRRFLRAAGASLPATAWRSSKTTRRFATLYSQAAGLTNFLVYYDGGRYRDALVSYLVAVYTGRDEPDTLAKLTGASYGELDKQYREFLETGRPKEEEASPSR